MLARRLTILRPAMTLVEVVMTTHIDSIAGRTAGRTALVTTRPCRASDHPISNAGLIGGGHVPLPGDVSRAHHGVRCLDARPECRHVLCSRPTTSVAVTTPPCTLIARPSLWAWH
jgi:magnesium chelatase family protein